MNYRTVLASSHQEVIVDLSPHWQKLSQYEDISDDLTEEEELRLLNFVRACGKLSHHQMEKRYDHWRDADRAHDLYVPPDATQFREKAVISDTRAVADTVLTYQMAALTGRNPMFQLEGMDRKSRKASLILERLLHQHMRRTAGESRMAQMQLDGIRYGFAPTKIVWDSNTNTNHIVNFDPRRAFPDPRVTWGDWERMQFMIFVDTVSTSALLATGQYPKLNKYPGLRRGKGTAASRGWEIHKWAREEGNAHRNDPSDSTVTDFDQHLDPARMIDEMWIRFNGYEVGLPNVGQIWMLVTVIDEEAIIRFQLNPYGRIFPIVIGSLYFDRHKSLGQSLYDLLLPIHDIATWLLRSRVDNVQASLNNLIFVDPTQVNVADLIDRNPWGVVQTLPGVKPGDGVYIAEVPDVTRSHWNDIATLGAQQFRVSAASDAQQGVPTADGGVRTATEIVRLSQLGSQRLGVIARIASATTIRPMARMMVGNIQDALIYEGSLRMSATEAPPGLRDLINDDYLDFDVSMLQGDIDYLVVDGTLPVEPTRNAETWMTMLQTINQTGLQMEYKTGKILEEAIRSMGITDLDQFKISTEDRELGPTPSQEMNLRELARGASVQPGEQVSRQVEKGNLIPAA